MAKAIFLRNPRFLDQSVARLGFDIHNVTRSGDIRVFQNGELFLFFSEKIDLEALESLVTLHAITELYFLDFADGAGSEVRIWDIILPAFFFAYDRSVETLEEEREAFSSIGKDNVVFLETYETQGDYDFGEFAMSIGGGAVSLGAEKSPNRLLYPKIAAAYWIDAIDTVSFKIAKALAKKIGLYVILCMKSDRVAEITTIEEEAKLAAPAVEILKFLVESTSEEDFIQITEASDFTSSQEADVDDDYREE